MEPDTPPDTKREPPLEKPDRSAMESADVPLTSVPLTGPDKITSSPVFVVEDSFFRSRIPRTTHWSIAWSDLMMTMFILFLSLFVYQLANREFISQDNVEIISGETIALPPKSAANDYIFHPISPSISEKQADTLKKVERMTEEEVLEDPFLSDKEIPITEQVKDILIKEPEAPVIASIPELTEAVEPYPIITVNEIQEADRLEEEAVPSTPPAAEPLPPEVSGEELISEIFDLSQIKLSSEKLERFASVELIPDKTMRIILTGDLLFDSGKAELTADARQSLSKLAQVIKQTPYMINVVGHTDSVPMASPLYATNWELSVARASRVTRFLIEDIGMLPGQFVVSGFSYYRPVKPNNNEQNRRANRRVEIILSKEPPPAVQANPSNIR